MRKRLTMSYLLEDRGDGRSSHSWRRAGRVVPYLRMRGRWLDRLGFGIGTKLRVEAEPGRLVLTAVPELPAAPDLVGAVSEVCEPEGEG
jgi:hypothetical protein